MNQDGQSPREQLLEGIISAPFRSACGISREGVGDQLLIKTLFGDLVDRVKEAAPTEFLLLDTFNWGGDRGETMVPFTIAVRADTIIAVTEVTEDMWNRYVTDQASRVRGAIQQSVMPLAPGRG